MKMRLLRYRVRKYKSVMDSGWIDCDDVTTLVGVNEAGKSNLLLALWKLNPAQDGEISFADDMPVTLLSTLRTQEKKPKFIEAVFEITDTHTLGEIIAIAHCSEDVARIVSVSRDYDGTRFISFPEYKHFLGYNSDEFTEIFSRAKQEVEYATEGKTEAGIRAEVQGMIKNASDILNQTDIIDEDTLNRIIDLFSKVSAPEMKTSTIRPIVFRIHEELQAYMKEFNTRSPESYDSVRKIVVSAMPKFVYYSNYGNLDSEIYLPHVIDNMRRTDLSSVTAAKARTLKVLFEYVNLDPQEILQMGGSQSNALNEKQIQEFNEKTKEREILLQSAATKLTRDFKEWWKQGEYIFDFKADGAFFRIWVSDVKRPERIPLENRSTGLQWFLSFYLIFLVESKDSHANSILLLDEAGLSLHPLAQKDLIAFFDNLSKTNQIIHTTHSPFLVSPENVDRARVVYVDKDGYTVASSDLRAAEDKQRSKSVYAIHAALGLSVSDVILQGCKPVIVEGVSDQYYLNAIKQYLISKNHIAPKEEIVFLPSGGVKGITQLASLISAKDGLPYVIVDSDKSGKNYREKLCKELYIGEALSNVLEVDSFSSVVNAEIEDLIPFELVERYLDRILHPSEEPFSECYDYTKPLIPQIEKFAQENDIALPEGYKVDMARAAKLLLQGKRPPKIQQEYVDIWIKLFKCFDN